MLCICRLYKGPHLNIPIITNVIIHTTDACSTEDLYIVYEYSIEVEWMSKDVWEGLVSKQEEIDHYMFNTCTGGQWVIGDSHRWILYLGKCFRKFNILLTKSTGETVIQLSQNEWIEFKDRIVNWKWIEKFGDFTVSMIVLAEHIRARIRETIRKKSVGCRISYPWHPCIMQRRYL